MGKNINRRNFLKVLGGSAAVTTATMLGCTQRNKTEKAEELTSALGNMTYRTIPSTGEQVSILAYGCMRWPTTREGSGRESRDQIDQEMVNQLIDYAIEHGVNYFDTSPVYCQGFSEQATGIALSRHPRSKFKIATKMSNFSKETWSTQASKDMYYNSLKELQVDYIDFMLLHAIGMGGMQDFNSRFIKNGILDFLLQERTEGRIKHLGFSYHGDIEVFDHLLSKHDKYKWDFAMIQLNYVDWHHAKEVNPRNTNAEYLYTELEKRNIAVMIMEPLLGGRLAQLPQHLSTNLKKEQPNHSIAKWAFRYAGTPKNVATVLSGMTYMEHLQENIDTYSPLVPISQTENLLLMDTARLMLSYPLVNCTACQYCMPCPYGIDIPSIFQHYNKCVNENNIPEDTLHPNYKKQRQAFLVGYNRKVSKLRQAQYCIGCDQCSHHCPQAIEIPKELMRIDAYAEKLRQQI